MDAYPVKAESSSKETDNSGNDAASAAALQQMLATSGALMSPLQFLPTSDGSSSATSAATLPWSIMPQYQMMVVPQSLLSAQGVTNPVSDGHIIITPSSATSSSDTAKVDKPAGAAQASQSVAAILQRREKNALENSASPQPDLLRQYFPDSSAVNAGHSQITTADMKPPKKPLTPYMTFSKMVS